MLPDKSVMAIAKNMLFGEGLHKHSLTLPELNTAESLKSWS